MTTFKSLALKRQPKTSRGFNMTSSNLLIIKHQINPKAYKLHEQVEPSPLEGLNMLIMHYNHSQFYELTPIL